MSSVSADPPMLLVCIKRSNLVATAIEQNRHFCVNLLAARHRHLSQVFAGQAQASGGDRFADGDWRTSDCGAPVLSGALATFECQVMKQIDLGSHTVYVGQVLRCSHQDGAPLLYHHRQYCQPQALAN
jgi:flavin reductase